MYLKNQKQIAKLLKYLSYINCTPYIRSNVYTRIKTPYYRALFFIFSAFSVIAGAVMLLGLLHVNKYGNTVQFVSSLGITVKFIVFLNCRVRHASIARIEEVTFYLNQMERLEAAIFKHKSEIKELITKYFMSFKVLKYKKLRLLISTDVDSRLVSVIARLPFFFLPICLLAITSKLSSSPCEPPYAGYFICGLKSGYKLFGNFAPLVKVANVLLFASSYFFVLTSASVVLFIELLGVFSFNAMVTILASSSGQQGRNSMQKTLRQRLTIYRSLQVLTTIFNNCYKFTAFVLGLFGVFVMIVANGYMLVRMNSELTGVFISYVAVSTTILYNVVAYLLKIMGQVYTNSTAAFDNDLTKNLIIRKQMIANQPLKMKLGESNFADRLTCFVFGSNVVENIVSYVLVSET